jgi:hypothetical protein
MRDRSFSCEVTPVSTARPVPRRPRPAPPVPRTSQQPLRRPRRWGRPLTLGLALVLVAALVPGAHADDDGDGGMPAAFGSVGDESVQAKMVQAQALADTFQDQPPAAAQDPTAGAEDGSADQIAQAADGAGTGNLPTGGQEPQDPAPREVAEHHQQEEHLPADQQPDVDPGDPRGEAAQLAQRFDANQECGADGGCSDEARIPPGAPTRGGTSETGPGGDQPSGRRGSTAGGSTGARPEPGTIDEVYLRVGMLNNDISHVRDTLRGVRRLETWDERIAELEGEYEVGHPIDDRYFQSRLDRARRDIEALAPDIREGTLEHRTLRATQRRIEHVARRIEDGVLNNRSRPSPPSGGESAMSIVGPEDVAGTPGDPSLKEQDKQLVTGPTGGHTGLTEQEQQALNQLPEHPGLTEQEQRDLQTLPGTPLTKRNPRDLQLPGTPLTDEQPDSHTHLAQASDGATSDQTTTTGRLARLAATATEWTPAGLATILAALLAIGCKGAPCSSMLRPAFRGFQGAPGQGVPGHLQG